MTTAVITQLCMAVIWTLVGVLGTLVVQTVRRERRKAAADNERVEQEFAPTLARCRPVIAAAGDARPSWMPAARDRWAGLRRRLEKVRARLNPIPDSDLAARSACQRVDQVARDVNSPSWPVNVSPRPPLEPAVGRAEVGVDPALMDRDFGEWVRRTNELLHQHTARVVGCDDTAVLPAFVEETADVAV